MVETLDFRAELHTTILPADPFWTLGPRSAPWWSQAGSEGWLVGDSEGGLAGWRLRHVRGGPRLSLVFLGVRAKNLSSVYIYIPAAYTKGSKEGDRKRLASCCLSTTNKYRRYCKPLSAPFKLHVEFGVLIKLPSFCAIDVLGTEQPN